MHTTPFPSLAPTRTTRWRRSFGEYVPDCKTSINPRMTYIPEGGAMMPRIPFNCVAGRQKLLLLLHEHSLTRPVIVNSVRCASSIDWTHGRQRYEQQKTRRKTYTHTYTHARTQLTLKSALTAICSVPLVALSSLVFALRRCLWHQK